MAQIKNDRLLSAIRKVLQELRAKTGMTQEAVILDIAETKKTTINLARIETGDGNISPSTIYLLCEYYKISISDFFRRVEDLDKTLKIKQ